MPNSIDLGFYEPDGWYDKAVIMPDTDSSFETAQTLLDHKFLYLSFAPTNYSAVDSDPFFVDVYFDGEFNRRVAFEAVQAGYYRSLKDINVGSFTVGTHTVELRIVSDQPEEEPSDNIYNTTFAVTQNPERDFYAGYYYGDRYSIDCKVSVSLDYGKYVFSGNFIGSELGRKVNARIEVYDSRSRKVATVSVKKGKVQYKEFVLARDTYTMYVLSTDNQKTADHITFNVSGEVFYKRNLNDNCIDDVAYRDPYTVTVQDIPRTLIAGGWVGFGDVLSCREIDFEYAGRYAFTINTTDQVKVSVVSVTVDGKGRQKEKKVVSASVSGKKKFGTDISFGNALLEKGTYYLVVEATNPAKGTNADYSVKLGSSSQFYTDADDGGNDWIYDKNTGKKNEDDLILKKITADTAEIYFDWFDVEPDDYDNYVGFGDAVDYVEISLSDKASLSFSLAASDAAKFSIICLIPKKGGKYTVKELQKTTLKRAKGETEFTAVTKALSLDAGNYYLCMQSTNAKKGSETFYNVWLNTADCSGLENLGSGDSSALDMPDELSFAQTAGTDDLSGASASGLAELNGETAWQDLASLA